jgi:hypothetical protein
MHWRLFSSTESLLASNRTEFQPFARQVEMTSRSGQWSRWSADRDRNAAGVCHPHRVHGVDPGHLDVLDRGLDDQWRPQFLGGGQERPPWLRSFTTLIAATPYLSAKARSMISLVFTIGNPAPPVGTPDNSGRAGYAGSPPPITSLSPSNRPDSYSRTRLGAPGRAPREHWSRPRSARRSHRPEGSRGSRAASRPR